MPLTLTKDANGFLDFLLTDDPAKSQAEGLKAWWDLLDEVSDAQPGDPTAPEGHECDRYNNLHGNVDLLLRYLHDLRSHAEGADAAFIDAVVKAFREWVADWGWQEEFADVLALWQ